MMPNFADPLNCTEPFESDVQFYLFGFLCCFQHCIGHITTGSFIGRGNQYIQLVKVLYCKLLTSVRND